MFSDFIFSINPFFFVFVSSLILSLIITLIYKHMTDQGLMKALKDDLKRAQEEMKQFRDNPEKMLSIQKKAMDKNMQYMLHSMKPTLVTFIPLILVFGWLNSNYAYEPIHAGEEFFVTLSFAKGVTGQVEAITPMINNSIILVETNALKNISINSASYKFKALSNGEWDLLFVVNNRSEYRKPVLIDPLRYDSPVANKFSGKDIKQITVSNSKRIVLDIFGMKLGWLGTYIILSILFSMSLRKLLNLY